MGYILVSYFEHLPWSAPEHNPSLQLTIFATGSIEEGECLLSFFELRLTIDTKANSRDGLTPSIRNNNPALLAMGGAFAIW